LEFLEAWAARELVNMYTGDEAWVRYDNARSSMWVGVDVERPTRVRRSIGTKSWWSGYVSRWLELAVSLPYQKNKPLRVSSLLRKFWTISTRSGLRRGRRRALVTLFCILTMDPPIGQVMISIVSELQDYSTRIIARISHPVISGHSEIWKQNWKGTHSPMQCR
jgi:hypothetical protein